MQILLANKQFILSFTFTVITLLFSSLSFSYSPGLTYKSGRDDINTSSIDESKQGCVYRESSGAWTVDDCDYVGAHYACYNGSEWRVAQALGTATDPGEPKDGNVSSNIKSVDLWDPVKADNLCKNYFGPSYFFSVPVNAEEDEKLGDAITAMIASKKRTWLYYYSNTENIALSANYWLGNRTEYTNLLSTDFGNSGDLNNASNGGVADCTLINRDTGLWQDAPCSESHSFACYDSGAWLLTSEQKDWKSGFSVCEKEYGLQTLYAVPRDNAENDSIKVAALPSGGTGIASDYNKVWLNRSDLAFEEFFISNQTRQAWWGEGQPTNRGNADCALIDSSGNWIAESCNGYVAYHACYLGDSSTGVSQWQLTDVKAESALGFGFCKKISENAEYRPPSSAIANNALATLVNGLPDDKFVWVNYTDQASEGFWKVGSPFLDFVNNDGVVDGDSEDCGYFSLETDDKRNWLSGQCFAGGSSLQQGFACTNGYEWKIATEALVGGASLESDLWKDGFTACETAFGKDYQFAAPYDADQNSRLSLALQLSGNTKAWINVNDAASEGNWVANGPVVNLSPVISSLTSQRNFPEKTEINLSATAQDPEAPTSSLTYQWSIIDTRVGVNNTGTDTVIAPVLSNANTSNVTISAVDLVNDNYYIDIQLQITDADPESPATTTIVLTLKVVSPLRAAYDFNKYTNPSLDKSDNNHDLIINTSQVEITPHDDDSSNYYARLDSTDSFSIDGSSSGLQLSDEYTLIYRFILDDNIDPTNQFAGFVQKGDSGVRQPAIFYDKSSNNIHFSNSTSTSFNEAESSSESVRSAQWMTVAYVKSAGAVDLYIDKAELNASFPDPAPYNVVPDKTRNLTGTSQGYASGDWTFGAIPDASGGEGITGGLDDIRIYDRALTAIELATIFPDQPKGVFEFANDQESAEENETSGAVNELLIPVKRIKGDDGIVSVGFELVSDSAILDTDFRLKDDLEVIGSANRGQGTLTWAVHEVEDKHITVELLGDTLREGTETFQVKLVQLPVEPSLGSNAVIDINIVDKTPNPYGAIGIAPTTGVDNIAVNEGDSGAVVVERVGSDTLGAFDVIYEIESLSAISNGASGDFTITQSGFNPTGATGLNEVVGSGRLSFSDNTSGIPVLRQTETISFTTELDGVYEADELFLVRLLDVTDPGSAALTNPSMSAILGTKRLHSQIINDITPGRISFEQVNYIIDEKDQGSASNVTLVALKRLDGNDGGLCVSLNLAGTADNIDDYTIDYLNPSASGQLDVFWSDQDSSDKYIQITAKDDEAYEVGENIELTWQEKASCSSASPDASIPADINTTTVSINDYTTPIKLKFTQNNYTVNELAGTASITIQATQSRLSGSETEGDFSNRFNNNTFKVYLERTTVNATEGVHYEDLSSKEVIEFLPSDTEKTITFNVVDNCDASPSLSASFRLLNNEPSLMNALPPEKIDVSSTDSALTITNGSEPIDFLGITPDFTGVPSRISPMWKGDGRLYVTGEVDSADLNPEFTEMALKADVGHNCLSDLQFNWSLAIGSTPLPSGNGLPNNFSILPVIAGSSSDKTITDKFKLPFVIKDTALVVNLSITDPETGVTYTKNSSSMSGLEETLTVSQNFRTIENNGEGGNNCVDWEGVNYRVANKSCNSIDRQNGIAYHPDTQQLVFGQESGGLSCITHDGGEDWLYARYCGTSSTTFAQKWSVTGDRVNSLDNPGIFFMESGLFSGSEPFARTDSSSYTSGAKKWTWLNNDGTHL